MSHKLTKEVRKSLAEFAKAITPPDYAPGAPGAGLTVEQLQERGISSCKGKPLQAGAVYVANHPPSVNHARRLETAYGRGGWPAVERYLQPFLTPEARARKAADAAGGAPAAADFAPLATDEPVADGAPAAAVWLDEASEVPAGIFEPLPLTSADEVQTELRTSEPREFTKLCQRWEREADERQHQRDAQLLGQLYEAGHPAPPADLLPCAPCRGACGICEKAA